MLELLWMQLWNCVFVETEGAHDVFLVYLPAVLPNLVCESILEDKNSAKLTLN